MSYIHKHLCSQFASHSGPSISPSHSYTAPDFLSKNGTSTAVSDFLEFLKLGIKTSVGYTLQTTLLFTSIWRMLHSK